MLSVGSCWKKIDVVGVVDSCRLIRSCIAVSLLISLFFENLVFKKSRLKFWENFLSCLIRLFWLFVIANINKFLVAALIFSAGYYSAPIFFTSSNFFSLYHFAAFSAFCVKSFWLLQASFSLLILLKVNLNISCSAKQFKMNRVSIKNWSQK